MPEASGRLQKWAIELGEHDIQYKPRVSIKGQAVADFFVEMAENTQDMPNVPEDPSSDSQFSPFKQWTLFVDGASSTDGSGAGLLLCDPTGIELTYALRFDFTATNNEAEYEALIAGIELARKMQVEQLQVYSDSQVVVNQINGSYEAREPQLQKYLARVRQLLEKFSMAVVSRIPRSQNKRADALSIL